MSTLPLTAPIDFFVHPSKASEKIEKIPARSQTRGIKLVLHQQTCRLSPTLLDSGFPNSDSIRLEMIHQQGMPSAETSSPVVLDHRLSSLP
jgi:hypothetical protein